MAVQGCCSLVAALFLSVYLSATDAEGAAAAKPGVCPRNNVKKPKLGVCAEMCSRDRDCPNDQKCCSNGCGHQCVAPYKKKPGVCPSKNLTVGACVESCSLDSNCPNNQKCCSNGCGHQCMAPYEDQPKLGVCPKHNVEDAKLGVCAEMCSRDRDCPNDQKCCSNGCGHQCVAPYKKKPGVCPSKNLTVGACVESCSLDSDCPNNQKCCSNGCGHQCMPPYEEPAKPGVCPKKPGIGLCVEKCSHDRDCLNDQKCCSNGCGHQCMAPYKVEGTVHLDKGWLPAGPPSLADAGLSPTPPGALPNGLPWLPGKPGVCPVNNLLVVCVVRQDNCFYDGNCPGNLKCCSRGCGRQCVAPYSAKKPGVCPSASRRYCLRSENLCSRDSTCPGDLKCCNDGCGRRCLPPYREKPGVCLRNTLRYCKRSENLCYQDGNCPGDLKCCTDGCGSRCVPPYKEKPGVCPSNNLGVGVCVEMCSQDSDCPNNQKCCSNGCGRQCVAPFKVRPSPCAKHNRS